MGTWDEAARTGEGTERASAWIHAATAPTAKGTEQGWPYYQVQEATQKTARNPIKLDQNSQTAWGAETLA